MSKPAYLKVKPDQFRSIAHVVKDPELTAQAIHMMWQQLKEWYDKADGLALTNEAFGEHFAEIIKVIRQQRQKKGLSWW
jgi:hypothetical protein